MDKEVIGVRLPYVTAAVVGLGTVTVVYVLYKWKQSNKKSKPPTQWKKIGDVDDLVLFPVKSMGPLQVKSFECSSMGPKVGLFRDRSFMVVNEDGRFISARKYPKMIKITPIVSNTKLTLSAPEMEALILDIVELQNKKNDFQTSIWGCPVICRDCGDGPAKWVSQYVLNADSGLRLVYYPFNHPGRVTKAKIKEFPLVGVENSGTFADESSFSMINLASVDDLNTRLEETVATGQFRMNIAVKNASPYDEDNWDWMKVGDVIFRNIKPCTRCIMTTIDLKTAEKNPKIEPLKTLKGYRQLSDMKSRRHTGDTPIMGIHLGLEGPAGSVQVGDPVYVGVS